MFKLLGGTSWARKPAIMGAMVVGVVGVGLTAGEGIAQEPAKPAKVYTLEDYTVGDSTLARLQKEYRGGVGVKIKGVPIGFKIDSDGEMSWEFGFSVPLKNVEISFDAGLKKPEPQPPILGPGSFDYLMRRESPFAAMEKLVLQDQIRQKDQEILALKAELAELKKRQFLFGPTSTAPMPTPWMPPKPWMTPAPAFPSMFDRSAIEKRKGGSMAAELIKSPLAPDKQ